MDRSYGSVVYRIIDHKIQFLLVEHSSSLFWDIPKGHPEGEEEPTETAIREVLEETNYHIEILPDFSKSIQYTLPRGEEKIVRFFLGKAVKEGDTIINPDEIRSVKWFSYEEAISIISFENSKNVIKSAKAFLLI